MSLRTQYQNPPNEQRLYRVLEAGYRRSQPVSVSAPSTTDKADQEHTERYFYIMHRVADNPDPYPDGTKRVLNSGGVWPGGRVVTEDDKAMWKYIYEMNGRKWTDGYADNGMHENILSFLEQLMNPNKGADSRGFKGLVSWYYLNNYDRQSILSFASDDELVFRVPASWLQAKAVACLEYMPHMAGDDTRYTFLPFAFLTALVVPLKYRITDPTPHEREEELAMTSQEVRDLIYDAHVHIDPNIRSRAYYKSIEQV